MNLPPGSRQRQSGQVMILVAILAIVLLLAALLVYNVGRVNLVRTRLQNTADSASYSSALVMARAYNFTAYSNRAMVANQVAIAQMVSLASWSRFYCLVFADSKCGKFAANGTDRAILFGLKLFGSQPGKTVNNIYQNISNSVFNTFDATTGPVVTFLDGLEGVLSNASTAYLLGTAIEVPAVADQVVKDNDPQAALSGAGTAAVAVAEGQLLTYQRRYTPLRRQNDPGNRFHNVTMASLDPWTSSRSGSEDPPFTTGLTAFGRCLFGAGIGGIDFFGNWSGTAALSNDNTQWTANDRGTYFGFGVCIIRAGWIPIPIPIFMPVPPSTGMGIAGGNAGQWQVGSYSGLRSYMGLSRLNQPDWESPTINLFVERKTNTVDTTKQMHDRGQPIAGGQLDMYDSEASGMLQVASSANAYFVRPDGQWNLGGYLVYGNLFNPYWEAHLVKTPLPLVLAADGAQAGAGP
ncbi:MAG: hypothetical protein JSR26_11055 [Proteobacteria bacterium]|nr:hypothetical protein [Pseudomonadota bacterium]